MPHYPNLANCALNPYTTKSMKFSNVVIIYNPNSTGSAKVEARRLRQVLKRERPSLPVKLHPTDYAGHATEIAYDAAKDFKRPLIISASGDGGYNEVVNGALQAQEEGARPVCAVLPAGNANDHARTMQNKPLVDLILAESVTKLDVLKVDLATPGMMVRSRYAHSYVGLGITPIVASELDKKGGKNSSVRETLAVFRTVWKMRPVQIRRKGRLVKYDSIICSIIPEMAKVFTISGAARPDDGRFELTMIPHGLKIGLVRHMVKGVFAEIGASTRQADFHCTLQQKSRIQFDGEVVRLAAATRVSVTICPGLLETVAEVRDRPIFSGIVRKPLRSTPEKPGR